jgi:hypothetical protein
VSAADILKPTDDPFASLERLQKECERQMFLTGAIRLEEAALQRDQLAMAQKYIPGMLSGENPRPYFVELCDLVKRGAATYEAISARASEFASLFRQMEEAIRKLLSSDECQPHEPGLPPTAR